MSRCKRCEGKGFVETWHGGSASWTPSLSQCPLKCDIAAYSAEVQRRLSNPSHVTDRLILKSKPSESKSAKIVPMLRVIPKEKVQGFLKELGELFPDKCDGNQT